MHVSYPKTVPVRSKALLLACRLLPCQWEDCGVSNGTVCAAHSNFHEFGGKGGARKADDNRVAALCHLHHAELDQGRHMNYTERLIGWCAAHERTVALLIERGLWPKTVAIPSMEDL